MKASVIISIYNHYEWTEMVLTMLERQTEKDFEVVLADDGSSEETVRRINEYIATSPMQIKHIWHEDKGWRKNIALNKAVMASAADYLIFMDGDCIPDCYFVEDHLTLRRQNFIIGGRRAQLTPAMSNEISADKVRDGYLDKQFWNLLFSGQRHAEDVLRIANPIMRSILRLQPKKKNLLGCNFSLYKADLLRVNGFDERYLCPGTGEDTDLEARLARAGVEVLRFRFICRVYHRFHASAASNGAGDGNAAVFNYNNLHQIAYTPWGIVKKDE